MTGPSVHGHKYHYCTDHGLVNKATFDRNHPPGYILVLDKFESMFMNFVFSCCGKSKAKREKYFNDLNY